MKKISFLLMVTILLFSCTRKEDFYCANAQLQICNPTTNQIVIYGWNTNQLEDTLFPGQCSSKDFGEVSITYDFRGNIKESQSEAGFFHTYGPTYIIDMESCFKVINAPGGYVDISHCYNGKFDADKEEFGVDCGGFCPPCEDVEVPCAANLKTDKIDWQVGSDDVLSSAFEIITDSKMQITFRFSSGQEMLVTLPVSSFPTADRKFGIGSEYFEAKVKYSTRFEQFDTEQSKFIYFISTGEGEGKIEFCDINFTGTFNNKVGSGSLRFRD